MATIGAIAARQFSIKPATVTTDSVEQESVIVMLPDGSVRIFDDSSKQTGEEFTAQIILSAYPNMHLTSIVSVVSPTTPLVPGETYFLAPKCAAPPSTRPPLTPPRAVSRSASSPFLPGPPARSLRTASPSDRIPLVRNVRRDLQAAVETVTRVSSPGCSNVRSEREKNIAESEFGFVARTKAGRSRCSSFCSARGGELEEEEDSTEQRGLYKSNTYSGRHNLKNGTGSLHACFATRGNELSPLRGESRRSRTSSNYSSPASPASPASSVSSVTSQRSEHKLPPSPLATPNPTLAEISALDEEIYIADVPPSLPAAATTTSPPSATEGSSIKAKVLATLAELKPRNLRRFTSAGKKLQSASAAADGADAKAAMPHSASESAQGSADADSRLFMMTDTRIGHRQPRTGGGSARAGYSQQGVAWAAPSQITWSDTACDQYESRTVTVRPGADFASRQTLRSPSFTTSFSTELDVPLSSSICRNCNGMSNCCSCEVQYVA